MADVIAIFTAGQRLVDETGTPYSGASVEFYDANTTTPKTVYSDVSLLVSLGTVVYTDSAGYPVTANGGTTKTQVYTGVGLYGIVIKNSAGTTIASHTECAGAVVSGTTSGSTGITQAAADVRYTRNANALSAITTIEDTDIFPLWQISGSANVGSTFANLKTELTTDFRADGRMDPVGTRMAFQQTTPPTGWTKETGATYNDAVTKFTTGTVAVSGSVAFSTLFASQTLTGTVGSDTPSIAKTAAHDHTYTRTTSTTGSFNSGPDGGLSTSTQNTSSVGSGTAHNHSLTMNALNMAVKYVEQSIGQKS